jgi:hypothetical protein
MISAVIKSVNKEHGHTFGIMSWLQPSRNLLQFVALLLRELRGDAGIHFCTVWHRFASSSCFFLAKKAICLLAQLLCWHLFQLICMLVLLEQQNVPT